jgi:release factor glutamine methyltransferase
MSLEPTVRQALAQSGLIPSEASVLLAHALECDRAWLRAHETEALPRETAERFFLLAKRRRDGEPVAYLTGVREFWSLPLHVTTAVMIPRPETETLVELALSRLAADVPLRILDLGTGSGAIALALAHERPQARVVATDVSEPALDVARANAQRLALGNVEFLRSDWYSQLQAPDAEAFDLIAANPPYVAAGDPHLSEGDLRFEPSIALSPQGDGLDALRTIVAGAPAYLRTGGWLVVEHGFDQSEAVRALFATAGFGSIVATRDLAGIQRVVAGRVAG